MITISILEDDDILEKDDWVRPLRMFDSDAMGNTLPAHCLSTYAGTPINNLKWVHAIDVFPFWIGHSILEMKVKFAKLGGLNYEIVRGLGVPVKHIWNWRKKD